MDSETLVLAIAICKKLFSAQQPLKLGGTVGDNGDISWSQLSTPSEDNIGLTYIVVSAHSTDPVCDVGDMIVNSNGTTWSVVPAGSDIDDTIISLGKTWSSNKISNELSGKSTVEFTQVQSTGNKIGTISIDNTPTDIFSPEQVSEIDDESTASNKTWSAQKISSQLILDVTSTPV